jgi:hypothetical protein
MLYAFLADKIFHLNDSRDIIFLRHYGTWLVFYLGVIFFYLLCKRHFNDRGIALLGCLLLVLHPRIFANSFYDSIDISFLSFYIVSLYTLVRVMQTKTFGSTTWHAFASAILVDIRSIGIVIPFLSYFIFFRSLAEMRHDKGKVIDHVKNILIYSFFLTVFIILFWPYLWRNPLSGIIEIVRQTPQILWGETVLYFGEYIKATELPWHYVPVWIGITTPILYGIFFVIGCILALRYLFDRSHWSAGASKVYFLFLSALVMPIVLVVGLNSTLYDSWRHMFFVYPAFVFIALIGIKAIFEWITRYGQGRTYFALRAAISVFILFSFLSTVVSMIQSHPFQYVYFNILAGRDMQTVKDRFDLDYWGLSYRQALENIIEKDKGKSIALHDAIGFVGPMAVNMKILPIEDRKRLNLAGSAEEAKYVLTNYRWHKQGYPYPDEFFSISVGNAKIASVFRLRN